jgi:hypothetical protein
MFIKNMGNFRIIALTPRLASAIKGMIIYELRVLKETLSKAFDDQEVLMAKARKER